MNRDLNQYQSINANASDIALPCMFLQEQFGFPLSKITIQVENLGVFFGAGVPSLSAAQGSLYINTTGSSTSTRLYVNTNGSTGWTSVTTAT